MTKKLCFEDCVSVCTFTTQDEECLFMQFGFLFLLRDLKIQKSVQLIQLNVHMKFNETW